MKRTEEAHGGGSDAKSVRVLPFSHLDLFWTGTREECLSRGNHIIAKVMDLLERHEDFRFLLETMNFVHHYLSCFPEQAERMKRLIAKGRLEVGPIWTATYLNLPGGETLTRNLVYGRKYAERTLDCRPSTVHFGDLPGYTPQYPQIAKKAGIDSAVITRSGPWGIPLFQWEGLDGSTILSYSAARGYGYYSVRIDWHKDYDALAQSSLAQALDEDTAMMDNPFMIHWGCDLFAPNEQLILNVRKWNSEGKRPLRFSTLKEYFDEVRNATETPVLKGEIPSVWPNIESSWPDIWPEDLKCEASLNMAEFLSSACLLNGYDDYPSAQLEDAWKSLLDAMDHNQNSQGGEEADRDKLELKRKSRLIAEGVSDKMAWRLAGKVRTPAEDAFPIVLFNSMSWERNEIVRARASIFGEVRTQDIPEFRKGVKLVDADGTTVLYVPLNVYEGLSMALDIAFHASHVPAAGYKAYYLVPGENPYVSIRTCKITADADADAANPRRNKGHDIYESSHYRVSVDAITGEISIYDLTAQKPLLEKMSIAGVEERRGDYITNMAPSGRVFPALVDKIETLDNNAVWCRFRISGSVYGMPFVQTCTLYHESADIRIENEIDWKEPRWVRIQQLFTCPDANAEVRYGVPYGSVRFPETMPGIAGTKDTTDEVDSETCKTLRLCRDWIDIGDASFGVSIGCDHRMWEIDGNILRSYMVRGSGFCFANKRLPDGKKEAISRPPAGKYKFSYVIRPRREAFVDGTSFRCGLELNNPLRPVANAFPRKDGELAPSGSLVEIDGKSPIVMSSFKKSEEGRGLTLRCFETVGRSSKLELPEIPGLKPSETDMLEEMRIEVPGRTVEFAPFEIKTFIYE